MDWVGLPPQYIEAAKQFRKVLLDPPSFEPGSWIGAGRVFHDSIYGEYLLAVRPRERPPKRAYEVRVYTGRDGENFTHRSTITREEISEHLGVKVASVEGTTILRDPYTLQLHLYISVEAEGVWETVLYTSDDPAGPWAPYGYTLRAGEPYDSLEARDPIIDIVDGVYTMLYKAHGTDGKVHTALAVSHDGKHWKKLGVPTIDGNPQPDYYQLTGTIIPGTRGPIAIGLARRYVVDGCGLARHLEAYLIHYDKPMLETLASVQWRPRSPYERKDYPTHGYSTLTHDPDHNRLLLHIEALDPHYTEKPGWRTQVDRWLLYEIPLP